MRVLPDPLEFQWDKGNIKKNLEKHGFKHTEIEEVFFNKQKKILKDKLHSKNENRYILLGKTRKAKVLFVVFTVRNKKARVISARRLNKKEMKLYEK